MQLSQLWCSPQENFLHNFSCFHCYCYCYCYFSSTIIFYKLIPTSFRKTTITQTSFQNYSSVFHTNFTLLKDFIALPYENCIIVSLLKILIVVAPIFERSITFNNTWNPYHQSFNHWAPLAYQIPSQLTRLPPLQKRQALPTETNRCIYHSTNEKGYCL